MRGQSSGSMASLLVQAAARWATVPEVSSIWSIHSVARARHDDLWGQHASSVLEDRFVRLVWRILHPRISDCRRMVGDDGEGSGYIDGRRSITLPPSERLASIFLMFDFEGIQLDRMLQTSMWSSYKQSGTLILMAAPVFVAS